MAALARALKLPVQELLELQRAAAEESGTVTTGGPGCPIGEWEPDDLEVHPAWPGRAASGSDTPAVRALPGYVPREHDRVLADAPGGVLLQVQCLKEGMNAHALTASSRQVEVYAPVRWRIMTWVIAQ